MKKTLVAKCATALISGLAMAGAHAAVVGPASPPAAVNGVEAATTLEVNTDGLGQILFVPYYSVQNGNDTYLSITNTDMRNGKAVKIRFRGASNSDDVFDFTLLMSPGDVWAAAITKGADGRASLVTGDKTCTLPNNISGQSFVTARLNQALSAEAQAAETREGYIEILNMADIPPSTAAGSLFVSIKHSNGVPANCNSTSVNALFTDSTDYANAQSKGLEVPTSGLMANWTIINVPKASAFAGDATAVEARDGTGLPGYGNIVLFPQAATPVTAALARGFTADPLLRGGVADNTTAWAPGTPAVSAAMYDFPDMSTPYRNIDLTSGIFFLGDGTKNQASLLTRALAKTSVANEYVTDASILGKSDWTFSMPTRRYNVARNYSGTGSTVFTNLDVADDGFGLGAINWFTPANTSTTAGVICVSGITTAAGATTPEPNNRVTGVSADREERFVGSATEFVISPGVPAAPLTFCGEASVLSFNAAGQSSVLGAALTRKDLTLPYTDGWVRIATPGLAGRQGLPIVGSSFMQFTNNAATAGTSGNYGVNFPHRATRY